MKMIMRAKHVESDALIEMTMIDNEALARDVRAVFERSQEFSRVTLSTVEEREV